MGYYNAHTPCIEVVRASGANHIVWCPGLMKSGVRSQPQPKTLLFADPAGLKSWDFVSYEDAAQVIELLLSAAETNEFDGKCISALSPAPAA